MKKIITVLLSCILGVALFVGCGDKKDKVILDKSKDITSGDLYNSVTSIYKDSKLKLIVDSLDKNNKTLVIELYFKKGDSNPKDLSDKYNNTCKEIVSKTEDVLNAYKDLTDIEFVPKVDGENVISYIRYKKSSNGFELDGNMSTPSDFEKSKITDEEINKITDNNLNNDESDNKIILPEKGEFKAPKLLESLNEGNTVLKTGASSFEVINYNDKKIVKVNLIYKNKVLIVGIVNNIRNNIENAFKDQCDEIDLSITQENPMDVYECKYIDGSWDKEVK